MPDKTAVDLFVEVGRLLYDGDDWPSRFAADLRIPKTRIRDIRRGAANLDRDGKENALLADALLLAELMAKEAERRAKETAKARAALKAWVKKHHR